MPVTFTNFGDVKTDRYVAAFNQAKTILSKAQMSAQSMATMSKSSPAYADISKAFKRFWGANDPTTIAMRIGLVKNAMLTSDLVISYDATDTSKAYVFASHCATSPGQAFTAQIQFCPALVTGFSSLGTNSAAGTIVHEMTHLVLNTDDKVYGMKSCTELTDPNKLVNADNYKYYSELFQLARLSLMPALSDSYDGTHSPPRK